MLRTMILKVQLWLSILTFSFFEKKKQKTVENAHFQFYHLHIIILPTVKKQR